MSSTVIAKNIQIGTSGTATNNFNWYQPAAPDGTVRLGVGNYGATTLDAVTVANTGNVTLGGTTTLTNISYSGTLTGGTGIVNLGSGQFYKDASGNVGIGTSSPGAKLEIFGGTLLFPNNQFLQQKDSSGNAKNIFGANSSNEVNIGGVDGSSPFNVIRMFTGGTERARIDSSGNLLVGNSTASQTMDGLFVRGKVTATGNQWNFLVYTQSGSFTFGCRDDYYLRSPAVYDRTSGGAANVFVDSSGYLYRSTSSIRYKRDVVSYDKGLETVSALRPVYYKSNVESPDGAVRDEQYAGFIAEEVAAAGLEEFVVRNDQGQPDALHYGNMVSLLTKAIQELTAKLDAAEARIAALEAK